MADFMAGMDPFLIFPEEVWELILDKTEDSQDAWNLLKAFPQLDANVALQKKKRVWLFGLVIPHIIQWRETSWITGEDLISCRQVCRQWSTAVDGFLESQPSLRAYRPETQGQVAQLFGSGRFHWNVKAYQARVDKYLEPPTYFGGTLFGIFQYRHVWPVGPASYALRRFLRDMKDHAPTRNPLLSRLLTLYTYNWGQQPEVEAEAQEFLDDILLLHRTFGEHVWFYKLEFRLESLGATCMTKYITYLPNLRLLHLEVGDEDAPTPSDATVKEFVELVGKALPPMPFLETLRIERCPGPFSHLLISRFAAQIRRLDLNMDLWRDEYSKLFPNLTEFDISDWRERPDGDQMKRLLFALEAPHLSKLQVKFPEVCWELLESCPFVIEDDMFQWLKQFPKMKFLDMGYCCRFVHSIERGTLDPDNDTFSSLRFLAIKTSFEMNYNFLRCLPSLQHLQLYVSSRPFVIDLSANPVVKIREEIQTSSMYKSNIWELLPKLETVVLLVEHEEEETAKYPFNRGGYELERKHGNGLSAGSSEDYAPASLRKDIIEALEEEWWDNYKSNWFPEFYSEEDDEAEIGEGSVDVKEEEDVNNDVDEEKSDNED